MQFTKNILIAFSLLSGLALAQPVAQAGGPSDYSVHCTAGSCTPADLEAISKAIELAGTNPDAVTWSVGYNVNDKKATRAEATESGIDPALVSACAAGKCSEQDIESLKKTFEAAQVPAPVMAVSGLLGSLDFTYGFKYTFGNATANATAY